MAALACRDATCCRGGSSGTLRDPRRHFVIRRQAEVDRMASSPRCSRVRVFARCPAAGGTACGSAWPGSRPNSREPNAVLKVGRTLDAIGTAGLPTPLPALGYRVDVARPKPQSLWSQEDDGGRCRGTPRRDQGQGWDQESRTRAPGWRHAADRVTVATGEGSSAAGPPFSGS